VARRGVSLAEVVFEQGHKLEHVFYSYPLGEQPAKGGFEQLLGAMEAIDFKGKLILSGSEYEQELAEFQAAAKKSGFTEKLEFALETDGWYTMT
jgi:hypothetical protein